MATITQNGVAKVIITALGKREDKWSKSRNKATLNKEQKGVVNDWLTRQELHFFIESQLFH